MHPNYSSISNQKCNDIERQGNCCSHQNTCHCSSTYIIERRKRKSGCCCSFSCCVFILLGLIFIGLIQRPIRIIIKDGWLSNNVYFSCSSMDSPNISWKENSVYYIPQDIKSLQIYEKNERSKLNLDSGKVIIIENKSLNQTRVTFDFKLGNNLLQNAIRVNEKQNKDKLELTIVHEKNGYYGCVEINTLIEVPFLSALNKLDLGFLNGKITIKDRLVLQQGLLLAIANGDLIIQKPIEATIMSLALANGDINIEESVSVSSSVKLSLANGDIRGRFQLNQSKLDASAANGNIDLVFGYISPVSTISAETASGNIDIQVPSDFDSTFTLSTVVGKVDVGGTFPENLHYRRSGHIVGETIDGNNGEHEKYPSKIKASTVAGNVKLHYH